MNRIISSFVLSRMSSNAKWAGELKLEQVAKVVYGDAAAVSLTLLRNDAAVQDGASIFILDDWLIIHVAPAKFPDAVERNAVAIRKMRSRLGYAGRVLPEVVAEGTLEGRPILATRRYRQLPSGRIGRQLAALRVRNHVIGWTLELAKLAEPRTDEASATFSTCLDALANYPLERDLLQIRSALPLSVARHVPMHGDLWSGNVLLAGDGIRIVDWAGAQVKGFGVYDLLRAASSFNVPRRLLRRELLRHAEVLGGTDALRLHLLAALGHLASDLGEFPPERYIELANASWRLLDRAIAS